LIRHRSISTGVLCLAILVARSGSSDEFDPPPGYYSSATGTGATLKSQLTTIMSTGHIQRTYGNFRDSAAITDADPNNPNNILLMYNRASVSSVWDNGETWNREHIWPISLQGGSDPNNSSIGHRADPHALRPANPDINATRGNFPFGLEGDSGTHGFSVVDSSYYYPGDADRGDAARSLFYSATRWSSLGLTLVDSTPGSFQMGDLSSLIKWHFDDAPDTFERRRNHAVYSSAMNPLYYSNNRNAYVDRPEFVWSVFMDQPNNSRITINGATTDGNGASTMNVDLGRVFRFSVMPTAPTFNLNNTGNGDANGTDGTYFEVTTSGLATSTLMGRNNAFRTGIMDLGGENKPITVGLNANTANLGQYTGTVTVNNLDVTDGGAGRGANDANDTFNVSMTVLEHATPSYSSGSTVTAKSHDFGTITTAAASSPFVFEVFNRGTMPAFTANMDFDTVLPSGDTSVLTTNAGTYAGSLVLAGGDGQEFSAMLSSTVAGSFAATYTLRFSDENIAGAQNNMDLTLNLSGNVVLAGDFNRDSVVDAADYVVWKKFKNTATAAFALADADGSAFVDAADLAWWRTNFGRVASSAGGSQHVPEPATPLLVAMAFIALTLRPRRIS
jgi:endonuclease I